MSKRNVKYSDLPRLQKKIILALAENGAMNISETNSKINGHESATNLALHKLESKEMVRQVETYEYRGRTFSRYWLSDIAIAFALINGADPEKVKSTALNLNREKTFFEIYFDLRSISSTIANILDTTVLFNGVLNPEELTKRLALEVASLGESEIMKFLEVMRASGKFDDALKNTIETMKKFMSKMEKA
jgi:hypothetical protein